MLDFSPPIEPRDSFGDWRLGVKSLLLPSPPTAHIVPDLVKPHILLINDDDDDDNTSEDGRINSQRDSSSDEDDEDLTTPRVSGPLFATSTFAGRPPADILPRTMHLLRVPEHAQGAPRIKTDPGLSVDVSAAQAAAIRPLVEWDWDVEHADRAKEAQADKAAEKDAVVHGPFQVDRRVLRDVVRERMGEDVGRIEYLSAGTFNKAYLVTLASGRELVARVSRRFMPRLKTSSEVATMHYLRTRTTVPVPDVYHYDSNPYNRLGGEFILMSKAPGIPLSKVYQSMSHAQLLALMDQTAALLVPLFGHRFDKLGSLHFRPGRPIAPSSSSSGPSPSPGLTPRPGILSTALATPRPAQTPEPSATPRVGAPAGPQRLLSTASLAAIWERVGAPAALASATGSADPDVQVGPIVSWPFFGSGRGDLQHPHEIDRGPWTSTRAYVQACVAREERGVQHENEGKAAPHRLHLDPDEIMSSRHHHLGAVPGDESDDSTEWDWEESEDEWEGGPGDNMYSDYRRMQRSTFLVQHLAVREEAVKKEMQRWARVMERLGVGTTQAPTGGGGGGGGDGGGGGGGAEEFALDAHDLNLENVFVDEHDPTKIVCIIDWESTTVRPLWAAAHLPAFVQPSPFTAKLFRAAVVKLARGPNTPPELAALAEEWLHHEADGARARAAHRCAEWDGWEEGLVEGILGPEENEEQEWFTAQGGGGSGAAAQEGVLDAVADEDEDGIVVPGLLPPVEEDGASPSPPLSDSRSSPESDNNAPPDDEDDGDDDDEEAEELRRRRSVRSSRAHSSTSRTGASRAPVLKADVPPRQPWLRPDEREKEKLLNEAGDMCGGRGGELGRRLEAWLYNIENPEEDSVA